MDQSEWKKEGGGERKRKRYGTIRREKTERKGREGQRITHSRIEVPAVFWKCKNTNGFSGVGRYCG